MTPKEKTMAEIIRKHTGERSSKIVIHNETIYLTGQVGNPDEDISDQTRTCLRKIDELLAEVGSDKSRILQTTIWLADMSDFAALNEVWNAWVPEGHAPARACGEAKLARPTLKVEMIVTAAL